MELIERGRTSSLSSDGHDVDACRAVILVTQLQLVIPLCVQSAGSQGPLQVEHAATIWTLNLGILVDSPSVI